MEKYKSKYSEAKDLKDPDKFVKDYFNGDYKKAFHSLVNHKPMTTFEWAQEIMK